MYDYFLLDKCEKMPSSCWGKYRRLAIVGVPAGSGEPSRIDTRIKGLRIVSEWRALSVGKTERCAYRVALRDAREQLDTILRGADK